MNQFRAWRGGRFHLLLISQFEYFPNTLTGRCSNASYGFLNEERGGKVRAGLYLSVFFPPHDLRVLVGDTIYDFLGPKFVI